MPMPSPRCSPSRAESTPGRCHGGPQLGADLRSAGDRLDLTLFVRQGELESPFTGALPSGLVASDELRALMRLASDWQSGRVPPRQHGILLRALRTLDLVRLDGDTISVSRVPLDAVIRVRPTGAGYRLSLDAPPQEQVAFGRVTLR